MDLLLDAHAFIWFINGDAKLSVKVRRAIANINNRCFISIASIWEIAIKQANGKIELKKDFNLIADFLNENEIQILPVSFEHLQQLLQLQYHHRDPFDRIIIAQAMVEGLTIATKDEHFGNYNVPVIW